MKSIRDEVLKRYKTDREHYSNRPTNLQKSVWHQMVEKWLSEKWQVLYINDC